MRERYKQPEPHPVEKRVEAFRLYLQGRKLEEICAELDVPFNTLAKWSSSEKWKQRKSDKYAGVSSRVAKAIETVPVVLRTEGATLDEKQAKALEAGADQGLRILEAVAETPKDELVRDAQKVKQAVEAAHKLLRICDDAKPSTVIQIGFLQSPDKPGVTAIYPPTQQPLTIEAVTV